MKLLDAVLARPVGKSAPSDASIQINPALGIAATDICALFKVPRAALDLLEDAPSASVALDRFLESGHLAEARRLLAYSMDRRDAIWWGYLCAMEAASHKPIAIEQQKGLDMVLAWLIDPNDIRRKQCKEAIRVCKSNSIAGILCLAVWLSGGSISPYAKRHIEPNPHVCGKLCGVTVYLASVYFDPGRWKTYLRHFIDTGIMVAKGECPIPLPTEAGRA